MELPAQFQDFIDSLDGVAYAVDCQGAIRAIGMPAWSEFALANGGADIADPEAALGVSVIDCAAGEDVRGVYRAYLDDLKSGERSKRIAFPFRCDGPDRRREMRMAISPLVFAGGLKGFLFHVVVWDEALRPAMAIYDFKGLLARLADTKDLPLLTMCSFCQRVRYPPGAAVESGQWVEATEYYRRGGTEDVAISHGICSSCREGI